MRHSNIDWVTWNDQKYKGQYFVADCEHEGDIERAKRKVINAGGIVDGYEWDGNDCGEAWIYYHCDSKKALEQVENKIGNGY